MADGLRARRAAALRLPPLADGRRDPLLELARRSTVSAAEPPATATCHICAARPDQAALALIFGEYMCRDRVDCYQRYKRRLRGSGR